MHQATKISSAFAANDMKLVVHVGKAEPTASECWLNGAGLVEDLLLLVCLSHILKSSEGMWVKTFGQARLLRTGVDMLCGISC